MINVNIMVEETTNKKIPGGKIMKEFNQTEALRAKCEYVFYISRTMRHIGFAQIANRLEDLLMTNVDAAVRAAAKTLELTGDMSVKAIQKSFEIDIVFPVKYDPYENRTYDTD